MSKWIVLIRGRQALPSKPCTEMSSSKTPKRMRRSSMVAAARFFRRIWDRLWRYHPAPCGSNASPSSCYCWWGATSSRPSRHPRPISRSLQNEVAENQAKVDLAIAKSDSELIESYQFQSDNLQKAWGSANQANNSAEADRLAKRMEAIGNELDKAIDRAVRHRCNR